MLKVKDREKLFIYLYNFFVVVYLNIKEEKTKTCHQNDFIGIVSNLCCENIFLVCFYLPHRNLENTTGKWFKCIVNK